MNQVIQEKGCFNCGHETVDHLINSHGEFIYSCEEIQEMDSEQYHVMMKWIN